MEYRTTDIRTGLFIAFSIAAFTVLIFMMGGVRGAFRDAREITIQFDDIRLLETEAPVTIGGYRVGEVKSITRREIIGPAGERVYKAEVIATVDRDLDLRTDAYAKVRTDGFLGQKFVALSPGNAPEQLGHGQSIRGGIELDTAGLMGPPEEPVGRLNRILAVVEGFAAKRENIENLELVIQETRHLLNRVRTKTLPEAESLLTTVREAARDVDASVTAVSKKAGAALEQAINTFVTLTDKVGKSVESLDKAIRTTETAVVEIRGGMSTLLGNADNLLVNADRLLLDNDRNIYLTIRNLRDAAAELDRTLRKIRADPSVVIWGDQEKVGPRTLPEDLDALRKAARARRYGKEPGK